MYRLRPYQQQAADVAVRYFKDRSVTGNGVMVLPTGSGKSLVIADIAARLGAPVLVFQPSKEILEQNKEPCRGIFAFPVCDRGRMPPGQPEGGDVPRFL